MRLADLKINAGRRDESFALLAPAFGRIGGKPLQATACPEESDASVIGRCQAGSIEAYEILLSRYRERVLNFAYALLGSRDDAEDAAQEAFIKVFSAIHTFRSEAQFWTWLYRITLNICLQRKRRSKGYSSLDDCEDQIMDIHPDAQQMAEVRMMTVDVLNELSLPLRVVLILREMHDLSYEDIATILEIPVGTVRSRISEARRKFKIAWGEEA
jgi:RNA polymerase sigma-70 factor (ECF subfamily)